MRENEVFYSMDSWYILFIFDVNCSAISTYRESFQAELHSGMDFYYKLLIFYVLVKDDASYMPDLQSDVNF